MPHLRDFRLVLFVAAVASTLLFGGQGGQEAGNTGSIRGTVKSSVTGQSIRKAVVSLRGASRSNRTFKMDTETDSQGAFTFEQLPYGPYLVSAQRQLYTAGESGSRTVELAEAGQAVELELDPTAIVTGRILDEDGEPARGVPVALVAHVYRDSGRVLQSTGGVPTNDLGEFRLWGIPAGEYYLRVGDDMRIRLNRYYPSQPSRERALVHPQVFYPGVIDLSEAERLDLKAGEYRTGFDLRRQRTTAVAVRGRVIAPEGTGWRRVSASFERAGPRDGTTSTSLHMPEFELTGVLPGEYVLEVREGNPRGDAVAYGRRRVTVQDTDIDDVTVELRPPITVSGTLVVEGPNRASDLSELMEAAAGRMPPGANTELRVLLRPEDGARYGLIYEGGLVGPDGRFEIERLAPNRYVLDVLAARVLGYVKSAKAGGVDVLEHGLDLESASPSDPLEITIGTDAGSVEALLTGLREGMGTAMGVLVPKQRGRADLYQISGIGGAPGFRFSAVPPGNYKLFVFSGARHGAWESPEFLAKFEVDGIPVKVEPNGSHSMESSVIVVGDNR